MNNQEMIQQELESIAPGLKEASAKMPFTLPENYFETFSVELMGKITLKSINQPVPEGYFEALPGTLLTKIKAIEQQNELVNIAPVLAAASREMPYQVPQGYFGQLSVNKEKTSAPVLPLHRKFTVIRWMAAASVVVLAGVFAWKILQQPATNEGKNTQETLATTQQHIDSSIATELAAFDESAISHELKENGISSNTSTVVFYLQTENIESALSELSEEEIKNQLADIVVVKSKS